MLGKLGGFALASLIPCFVVVLRMIIYVPTVGPWSLVPEEVEKTVYKLVSLSVLNCLGTT